ncbi:hypothetical protein [Streptomyces silvisoli]|uniref:Uncharacterized protein n=1 Tax=Streptomyces silvisoli TaxID=3034235 RepID=A0ABT5ZDB7_9ACTN|nr:hypothetical protein [Streptomyces silvisoli]MDF3287812.1 hypothetical protein [Streptomyces silvisoli]
MRRYRYSGRNPADAHTPQDFAELTVSMPRPTGCGLPADHASGNCQTNQPKALAFG